MLFLPSIQPCTLTPPPRGGHTVWNWGHAGGGESPTGTYRGTGRCNQGQGLCNFGWRRSWLGNLGNLMGQRGRVTYLALSWGTASLDLRLLIASLWLVTENPQVCTSHLHTKPRARHGVHFIISLNLESTVTGSTARGLNVQTRKLRHRELTLDKNDTTLSPNSSHSGSRLPLLLDSHTPLLPASAP